MVYTERALAALDPERHQVQINGWTADSALIDHQYLPVSLLLRDGTSALVGLRPGPKTRMSSTVSTAVTVVLEGDVIVEEVDIRLRHEFYDKHTSSGKPMWQIAGFPVRSASTLIPIIGAISGTTARSPQVS